MLGLQKIGPLHAGYASLPYRRVLGFQLFKCELLHVVLDQVYAFPIIRHVRSPALKSNHIQCLSRF